MGKYQQAYDQYKKTCEKFGLEGIPFYRFTRNLTEDQIDLYIQQSN